MSHLSDRHSERLADLMTLDGDVPAAFLGSPLSGCHECQALLRELTDLTDALDEVGRDQRATLSAPGPVGEGRAEAALRAELGRVERARPRPLIGLLGLLAAASLIITLVVSSADESPVPDPIIDPGLIMGSAVRLLEPVGLVSAWEVFRFEGELPGRARWRIAVYDDSELSFEPLDESPWLTTTSWQPPADAEQRWPPVIRWTLEVVPPGDAADVDLYEARAERVP